MEKVLISEEVREAMIASLNTRAKKDGYKNYLQVKKGDLLGQIIYVLAEMNISCTVFEDESFFYREFASGTCRKISKQDFFNHAASESP
jgi:hypothetical protein